MKKIIIVISLITITLVSFAGPVQELMELAESAFSKGDYVKAKGYYSDIINLQSATDSQRKDARYNLNVCQSHINDAQYISGYNRAISLFKGKQFVQSRDICVGLLKYSKFKPKTNNLIKQCNDSINARFLAQQVADSIQQRNQLRDEYNTIIDEALAYYNNKQYLDAINTSKKLFESKFEPLEESIPDWLERANQIHQAQCQGKAITPEFARHLENAIAVGDINDNIARIVFRNNRKDSTLYVSTDGDIKILESGYLHDDFHCGFLGSRYSNGARGYYDTMGKYHSWREIFNLDDAVTDCREFSDGMAPVQFFCNGKYQWGYISKDFKIVVKPQYDFVTAFSEERAFVRKKGKWSIIDKEGEVILDKLYPAFFGSAHDGENGYYPRVNNSYYNDGKIWIQTKNYHNILADTEGTVLLDNGDYKSYNILHNGKPLYEWVTFSDGLIIYLDYNDKYGYMNASGKVIINPEYDLTYGFHEGIAAVKSGNNWGFIDKSGKLIVQPSFEAVSRNGFSEGLCAAQLNGKWGFVDMSGTWVIEPIYECPYRVVNGSVGSFHNGFAAVALNGQLGYVDKFGNSTFDFQ